MAHQVEIRGQDGSVTITVMGWTFPDPETVDEESADWLDGEVAVEVPGFTAQFPLMIWAHDLRHLYADLQSLLTCLGQEATATFLHTYEGQLYLAFALNKKGHVSVKGEAYHPKGIGNALTFTLEADQTYLAETITGLARLLSAYAPRRPDAYLWYGQIQAPIVLHVPDEDSIEVYPSVVTAERSMEAIDVKAGRYLAYDGQGRRLQIVADTPVVRLHQPVQTPSYLDELRPRILKHLESMVADSLPLRSVSTDALLYLVLAVRPKPQMNASAPHRSLFGWLKKRS